jgi:hypothetical protein
MSWKLPVPLYIYLSTTPQKHTVDTPVQYPKKPTPAPTPTSSLTTRGEQQEASADGTAEVTPCGTNDTVTKWCCGHNNTACCFEDSAQNIPVSLGVSSTSSSSATTSASATTTTIPTPSSTTSSNSNSNNTGLTTGDKAGIGVGVAGGAILFVGLGLSIAWFQRRRKEKPAAYELHTPQGSYSDAPKYAQFSPAPLSGMGRGEPSEMAAEEGAEERRPVEMA